MPRSPRSASSPIRCFTSRPTARHRYASPPPSPRSTRSARPRSFPIKKGVKFHDGSELTPADVVASLQREKAASRWLLAGLTGITADGEGIVISLRAPLPDLLQQLALPQFGITKGGKGGDKPIGTGAYAIDGLDRPRKRLVLRAFDEHFLGRPYVDQLVLTWFDTPDAEARRFETGKSHISARGASAFAGTKPTYKSEDISTVPRRCSSTSASAPRTVTYSPTPRFACARHGARAWWSLGDHVRRACDSDAVAAPPSKPAVNRSTRRAGRATSLLRRSTSPMHRSACPRSPNRSSPRCASRS